MRSDSAGEIVVGPVRIFGARLGMGGCALRPGNSNAKCACEGEVPSHQPLFRLRWSVSRFTPSVAS